MTWKDLWTSEGEVDRGPYLAWGFGLLALKYNLERLVAGVCYHRSWSVLAHYLHAPSPDALAGRDAGFYRLMVALSLPFIWTGVCLTVRRLRSAGLPAGLACLFFAPVLNLFFFLLMAALPPAGHGSSSPPFVDRLVPRSRLGSAVLVAAAGGALVLGATVFSTSLLRAYGWSLFVGLPFVLGFAASVVHGHHEPRSLGECLAVAALSVTVAGLVLFAAAVEGVICLAMAAPLAFLLAGMGAVLGYFIQRRPRPQAHAAALLLVLAGVPALMGAEYAAGLRDPSLPVRTSIDVAAPPEAVWRRVVSFSELPPPRGIRSSAWASPIP